jgi:twitching motility two-component system response regulator PilG
VTEARIDQLVRDGIAAAKAGDKPKAQQLFSEVTTLDGRSETAWLWLAGLAETPGEALVYLERVLALNPDHERARAAIRTARVQAGVAAARSGDRPQARTLLRAAVANDPAHELAWLWLASVAETPTEAIQCLERVLTLNPANERARAGLERLRTPIPEVVADPPVAPSTLATSEAPPAPADGPDQTSGFACPFCGQSGDERDECEVCGALLTLTEPATYLKREGVDSEKLQTAIERLQSGEPERDFDSSYQLGLAWLNLGEIDTALPWFKAALQLRPEEQALKDWLSAVAPPQPRSGAKRAEVRRKTVLVVDDSPTIRKLVALTVERHGYQARLAGDAYEAIDQLRDHGVPDLILLDITMPGMDGYQLCKLLRQNTETATLPIIMLSGKDGFFSKVRGRMCGSTEYMTKPFDPEGLLRVVEKYCAPDDAAPVATPGRG